MRWIDLVKGGTPVFTDDPQITEHVDFDESKMLPIILYSHQRLNISAMLQLEQIGQSGELEYNGKKIKKTSNKRR